MEANSEDWGHPPEGECGRNLGAREASTPHTYLLRGTAGGLTPQKDVLVGLDQQDQVAVLGDDCGATRGAHTRVRRRREREREREVLEQRTLTLGLCGFDRDSPQNHSHCNGENRPHGDRGRDEAGRRRRRARQGGKATRRGHEGIKEKK
jgi:hypothetical protein